MTKGAPKGNQYAKGNPNSGRPRQHDRELMAKDIIEWVQDEDNWIIKEWRIKHMMTRDTVMEMCRDSKVFADAYKYANDKIASRRERMHFLGEMKDNLFNRMLRVYDKDIDSQERDNLAYEYSLKEKSQQITPETLSKFEEVISQLDRSRSALNKLETNNNTESRS
jgi:hypothetical protein